MRRTQSISHEFTLYEVAKRNAQIFPDRLAVIDQNRRLTFLHFFELVNRLSVGLRKEGIRHGDRVAVISRNNLELFALYFAVARCGGIFVPVNTRLSRDEVEYILKDCQPKLLFVESSLQITFNPNLLKVDSIQQHFSMDQGQGHFAGFEQLLRHEGEMVEIGVRGKDGVFLIYTAATGGRPRGALLTHANVLASNLQVMHGLSLREDDIYLAVLPFFHVAGLMFSLNIFHAGGANVILPQFDSPKALEIVQQEKVSVLFEFSPMLTQMVEKMAGQAYDLSSVRLVLGITYPECFEAFRAVTGAVFYRVWGQTETLGLITACRHEERPGSVGKALPLTDLQIIDDQGYPMEVGQSGEIVIRSPQVFKGYWNLEQETDITFRDGWHHTGDLGRLDEKGFLWFMGRKQEKDLIKTGGENVYPTEVESAILRHSQIEEVAVIGVPDPQWDESIKAICVVKGGGAVSEMDLIDFVSQRIASYKKPRHVQFVRSLPKTENGEIDRVRVKALYGK